MFATTLKGRLFSAAQALLLVGSVAIAAALSHAAEWRPLPLVGLLLALGLIAERLDLEIRGQHLSASLVPLALSMTLLGPAPAVLIGVATMILNSAVRRLAPAYWLTNLSTSAAHPLAGALLTTALIGNVHDPRNLHMIKSVSFALVVGVVLMSTNALNFLLIALDVRITEGRSILRQVRELFVPMQPGQLAMGALTAILAVAYTNLGLPTLVGLVFVLVLFQYLMAALLRSEDRADALEARSIQLVRLQLGVLRTLVRALEMRDPSTSHHASAVARYSQGLAKEIGCTREEQEVVRTAALLHEIGKFTWPDRVLHSAAVTAADEEIVKRHPQDGAMLVGALDGYGEVADAILYHHERMDGAGYPARLIGAEIPLASRILAICSTYDTMTGEGRYRSPMTPEEAIDELRHAAANGQLDPELTESFIVMLEREGPTAFLSDERVDVDAELEFERRVREMAEPKTPAATALPR